VDEYKGVFLYLGIGMCAAIIVSFMEQVLYKYTIPYLRNKPLDSSWKSLKLMFISQVIFKGFVVCIHQKIVGFQKNSWRFNYFSSKIYHNTNNKNIKPNKRFFLIQKYFQIYSFVFIDEIWEK
jgi:hypothetical protein